jgi:DNA polymerase III subunit alpha
MHEAIKKEFNHLKIHTQYSICEGALRTADLAKHCKENKTTAVGLCDSNNLCGALEFSESIAKQKTQPIIGIQINVKYKNLIGKIPLFAKNLEGYKNLIKLSSKSYLEINENDVPHCTLEDILSNSDGLIILTGSLDGLIGKLFYKNLTDQIYEIIEKIKKVFIENVYIEIQRHGDDGEVNFEKFLLNLCDKWNLPLIATHEVFYLDKDMHEAHDAYLCVGEKTYVNVKDRRKYSDQHYLKTAEEMNDIFKDLPEALENNKLLPLRISYRPKNSLPVLPNIQTKKTDDIDKLLINEASAGLNEKLKEYIFPYLEKKVLNQLFQNIKKG